MLLLRRYYYAMRADAVTRRLRCAMPLRRCLMALMRERHLRDTARSCRHARLIFAAFANTPLLFTYISRVMLFTLFCATP